MSAVISGNKLDSLKYVVGFDLGHGETALTMINLKAEDRKRSPSGIEINGKSNFITAIAYHPMQGVLIGDAAITTNGVIESHIAFKKRPDGDLKYEKILSDFANYIYQQLKISQYGITDDNTLFIVGCPTDWAKHESRDLVAKYEKILHEKAKIPFITVVAESRGALMNGIESGEITSVSDLKGRVLVIDLGSSTADFTLIDLEKRRADPFDFGQDLGAALIDKLILRYVLNKRPKVKEDLLKYLKENPVLRNLCEVACRKAKEVWFNNPNATPQVSEEIIPDELDFRGRLTTEVMQEILQEPLTDLKDIEEIYGRKLPHLPGQNWSGELKSLLQKAKEASEKSGGLPDILLLTGGASRMNFVKDACYDIFPKAKLIRGTDPEYSISRGLACWGRVDIRSQAFVEEVKSALDEHLLPEIERELPTLFNKLATVLTDDVMANVVKPAIAKWKETSESVDALKRRIRVRAESWGKSDTVKKKVNSELTSLLSKIAEDLNRQHLKNIVARYNITDALALNASEEIQSMFSSGVDVKEKLSNIINVSDVNEVVQEAQDEVIGIILGSIIGIIVAVLLLSGIGTVIGVLIGVASWAMGKEAAQSLISGGDIPVWIKGRIDIESKVREQKSEIVTEIRSQLNSNKQLKENVLHNGREVIDKAVLKKVEDVRVFID